MMIKSSFTKPAAANTRRIAPEPAGKPLLKSDASRGKKSKRRKPVPSRPELELEQEIPAEEKKQRDWAWKMILIIIAVGIGGLGYLNHVFKTQAILKEVGELEREYEKTRRIHADRKFTFERMTGPSEVYDRARQQGLVHGGAAEGVIIVKP